MARRNRIQIVTANCDRCGKQVATANHSIMGLDSLKAEIGIVCQDCFSVEEEEALLRRMGTEYVRVAHNA